MDDRLQEQMQVFAKFLQDQYAQYVNIELGRGHGIQSQTDFAKYLGVTQASFSNWINAVRPPNRDNLDALNTKLGPRVYDIFGLPRHMPKNKLAAKAMEHWHQLTENQQRQILEEIENFVEDNEKPKTNNSNFNLAT